MTLQDEFFEVEGTDPRLRGWAYVTSLFETPRGKDLDRNERKALLYLALYELDGVTRPSMAALSMVVDLGLRETRELVEGLLAKGVLRSRNERPWSTDVQRFEFVELTGR